MSDICETLVLSSVNDQRGLNNRHPIATIAPAFPLNTEH